MASSAASVSLPAPGVEGVQFKEATPKHLDDAGRFTPSQKQASLVLDDVHQPVAQHARPRHRRSARERTRQEEGPGLRCVFVHCLCHMWHASPMHIYFYKYMFSRYS